MIRKNKHKRIIIETKIIYERKETSLRHRDVKPIAVIKATSKIKRESLNKTKQTIPILNISKKDLMTQFGNFLITYVLHVTD